MTSIVWVHPHPIEIPVLKMKAMAHQHRRDEGMGTHVTTERTKEKAGGAVEGAGGGDAVIYKVGQEANCRPTAGRGPYYGTW